MTRILIVDDEPDIRELLAEFLTGEGFEVLAVGTGREAIEAFASDTFDALLLDWGLPGIRAREVMSQIIEIHPGCRVFLMTGNVDEGQRLSGAQGPILGVFRKPFSLRTLASTIRRGLG
ncbi:MAG: response regulator [Deltaproteobacteria bacterium]|nr:response regulator [Deltaproteobacteria bacterium]